MLDAYCTSGSSPTQVDFVLENHGRIFLLEPLTPTANSWVEKHLPEDHITFGGSIVIEHRYIVPVVEGIAVDGLEVR